MQHDKSQTVKNKIPYRCPVNRMRRCRPDCAWHMGGECAAFIFVHAALAPQVPQEAEIPPKPAEETTPFME